mmetsp:Transcript_28624/g.73504  ORF Transcript_28624/g.73504 Transcript_28624/m.73504 type:complete len:114 (+) Transcript_28624:3058-3399(+)
MGAQVSREARKRGCGILSLSRHLEIERRSQQRVYGARRMQSVCPHGRWHSSSAATCSGQLSNHKLPQPTETITRTPSMKAYLVVACGPGPRRFSAEMKDEATEAQDQELLEKM